METVLKLLPFFVLFGNMFVSLGLVFLYGLKWFQETWPMSKTESSPSETAAEVVAFRPKPSDKSHVA